MTILTEPGVADAKHTLRAIAVADRSSEVRKFDVVVINDCKPVARRIRGLVTEFLGEGWNIEWFPTGDCF